MKILTKKEKNMKNSLTKSIALIFTSMVLTFSGISSAYAWGGTTSYTTIGNNTWSYNNQSQQQCVYTRVGNTTYRNCY